jgi:4-hydroxy-tetrahydrodipicolinate synthase
MSMKEMSGVYAAVLTPRLKDNTIDIASLDKLIRFLLSKSIASFALNGATGEYCLSTPADLRTLLRTVQEASEGKAEILCGIGAPGIAGAIEFAALAQAAGVRGLLLPPPDFFPYQQEDVDLFCRTVASTTDLPILLYNLPQFTSPLMKETVRCLVTDVPNIVGIKDSSGSLDILRDLTGYNVRACRIVGNDGVLAQAMAEGVCDGVVSGVACALPELISGIYQQSGRTETSRFRQSSNLLDELLTRLDDFPTPWGLKWILEARGIIPATFAQPITKSRILQSERMISWFHTWFETACSKGKITLSPRELQIRLAGC